MNAYLIGVIIALIVFITVGVIAGRKVKDTNDYYVAGDVNLGWVMYAEIALDVIITVVTAGLGEAALVASKEAAAARESKNMINALKDLQSRGLL